MERYVYEYFFNFSTQLFIMEAAFSWPLPRKEHFAAKLIGMLAPDPSDPPDSCILLSYGDRILSAAVRGYDVYDAYSVRCQKEGYPLCGYGRICGAAYYLRAHPGVQIHDPVCAGGGCDSLDR